jgi:SAM-dependent methyltransferase
MQEPSGSDPKAMDPFGAALHAFFEGDPDASLILRRDDGQEAALPIGIFFRKPEEFSPLERTALDLCSGRVLDVGAGTGLHSLFLQEKGLWVTAIDVNPMAVSLMTRRGVKDVRQTALLDFRGGAFETILLLGHGIGMVETIAGLDRFLAHAKNLLSPNGRILVNSIDVRITDDPSNLAYHEANRKAGRYIGEVRMQFEHKGRKGPFCGWLHVDFETLSKHAAEAGLSGEKTVEEKSGEYLSCLTRTPSR